MPLHGAFHTVTGCVRDDKGAPVPRAIIHLTELEGPLKSTLVADTKGCYKLELLPDGAYEIRAGQNGSTIEIKQFVLDEKKMSLTVNLHYRPVSHAPAAGDPAPPMINLKMLAAAGPATGGAGSAKDSLIKSVSFSVVGVDAGDPTTGKIALAKPAPPGGVRVGLSVSHPALAEVPPELIIGAGFTEGWFPVKTNRTRGPSDVRVRVVAADGEGTASGELLILSFTRITVRVNGAGSVVSIPAGVKCSAGICSQPFRDGESVQLLPQPDPGWVFRGWSGDCGQDGTVVVSGRMSCIATFAQE